MKPYRTNRIPFDIRITFVTFSLQSQEAIRHNRIAEYNYTVAAVVGFDYLLFDGIDRRAA